MTPGISSPTRGNRTCGYAAAYAYVASASIVSNSRRAEVTRPVLPHSTQPTVPSEQRGHDVRRSRRTLSSQSPHDRQEHPERVFPVHDQAAGSLTSLHERLVVGVGHEIDQE
jgi:hypothetical protein